MIQEFLELPPKFCIKMKRRTKINIPQLHRLLSSVPQKRRLSIGTATFAFGFLAFLFGVIAENKKPADVKYIQIGGATRCFYPSDPSIALGSLSIIFLAISSCSGVKSIFFSYNGKTIPTHALWRSTTLVAFFILSIVISILATSFLIWATITEGVHRHNNVHWYNNAQLQSDSFDKCPTAKTGLFGGAGFLALDASLFWLICQMLTMNAREDYEDDVDTKGDYGNISGADYVSTADIPVNSRV